MNVTALLRRLEAEAERVRLAGKRCPDCGGPVPSMLPVLVLGPQGVVNPGTSCPTCAETGGGGNLALDPRTGRPEYEPRLILLNLEFSDWWAVHGSGAFARVVELTLQYHADALLDCLDLPHEVRESQSTRPRIPPDQCVDSVVLPPDFF